MSYVKKIASRFDGTKADRFRSVLAFLQKKCCQDELDALQLELDQLVEQLDALNRQRASVQSLREDVRTVMDVLSSDSDAEAVMFRMVLSNYVDELEDEFAQTRPDALHSQKVLLRRELAKRKLLARLLGIIGAGD